MIKNIIYFNNIEFRLVRFHGEDRHPVHIMHKDKPRFPWSEILRRAWWFIGFRNRLSYGFATFSFWKKDGSIREAKGTLFMPLIPMDKWPKEDVGVRCTVYGVWCTVYGVRRKNRSFRAIFLISEVRKWFVTDNSSSSAKEALIPSPDKR